MTEYKEACLTDFFKDGICKEVNWERIGEEYTLKSLYENSIITMMEASLHLDKLFRCGIKTTYKASNWVSGRELDACYYDCTIEEEANNFRNIFTDSVYKAEEEGLREFRNDFVRWVNKGWEIELLSKKRKGEYLPEEPLKLNKLKDDRKQVWKKIEFVFESQKRKTTASNLFPPELNTDEAFRYFQKAVKFELMSNENKWLKGLQLLACFAREMSNRLNLGKGQNANGTPRISWKPFEDLFDISKGKLRANYNDIQKTGQEPKDINLVNQVFD